MRTEYAMGICEVQNALLVIISSISSDTSVAVAVR